MSAKPTENERVLEPRPQAADGRPDQRQRGTLDGMRGVSDSGQPSGVPSEVARQFQLAISLILDSVTFNSEPGELNARTLGKLRRFGIQDVVIELALTALRSCGRDIWMPRNGVPINISKLSQPSTNSSIGPFQPMSEWQTLGMLARLDAQYEIKHNAGDVEGAAAIILVIIRLLGRHLETKRGAERINSEFLRNVPRTGAIILRLTHDELKRLRDAPTPQGMERLRSVIRHTVRPARARRAR